LHAGVQVPGVLSLRYEDGTVRVEGDPDEWPAAVESDPRVGDGVGRTSAYRYADLLRTCREQDVDVADHVLDSPSTDADLVSDYELRSYQREALDAWEQADRRGVVELPTGAGKTVVGLAAMATVDGSALVVVPTIDLLEQWRRELQRDFPVPVGRLGGGEQRLEAVTVATYDSAYLRADEIGDRFRLVVFDEVHHLGAEGYREIARLLAAPARLGLTATFERPDGGHEAVRELVGDVVIRLAPDALAGDHLAPYDVRRVPVELTDAERAAYECDQATFTDYLARSNMDMRSGSDYRKLVLRSGSDPAAREALLAKQRAREIVYNSDAKIDALAEILDRHRDDRVIVFTAHNDLAHRVAERFLVPAITHHTGAAERRRVLDRFREGTYSRVVSSNVLDEGVDVPDANVAVVLSGSGSEREFTQRLGRVLRPSEDRERAVLYEVVADETAEENVAERRR
jgi:superfamily II DNA or RNA helicase